MPDMEHNLFCTGNTLIFAVPLEIEPKVRLINNSYRLNLHEISNSQTHQNPAG
jgi:hypothetical protein